jgi:hypothetical protein
VDPARCPPPSPSVAISEVTRAAEAALVAAMGADGDLVPRRRERGCRAFTALRDGEVVAYGWLSAGREWIGELGLEIRPGPREAYIWNCLTLEPHRRQGLFRNLVLCMAAGAGAEGLTRLWIGSIDGLGTRALAGAGFVPVLRFTVKALPWLRRLRVWAAEEAEPELVAAGRRALYSGRGPLRGDSVLGRAGRRRH